MLAVLGLALAAGAWWAARWDAERRYQADLEAAKAAMVRRAAAPARAALARAEARFPARGEAPYLLGAFEASLGRGEAAEAALARVPPGSEFAAPAALMLARRALEADRMATAEPLLRAALGGAGRTGIEAREVLLNLLKLQGRAEEARRLVREGWAIYPDRVGTLQQLWRLDTPSPVSLEQHRYVVEQAGQRAPDDDRVWLAQAALAIRLSRFEEARGWLARCEARRPADPAVWRNWLDWALATQDPDLAGRALGRLSAESVAPEDLLAIRAWLAARAGDVAAERRALEALVRLAPGRLAALDRLAGLALLAGDAAESARLRARKAELDRVLDAYSERLFRPDPEAAAEALAGQAEVLGRWFEARGWWELAVAARPSRRPAREAAVARLDRAEAARAAVAPPGILAELAATRPRAADAAAPVGAIPTFVEVPEAAGLRFTYDAGKSAERQIPETMGTGLGLLDYDGDGWLDVYAAQGGPFPPRPAGPPAPGDRLFRNRGDGTFEDATEAAGLPGTSRGYGHGVAVGDVDDDGDPDLFVTRWGSYALYRNEGGKFVDATAEAGLGGDRDWPTSAAFADLDADGDLDLYVCHYLVWDGDHPTICRDPKFGANRLCNPGLFPARPDRLYRNDGGRFADVTAEAGIVDEHGRGMGVVAVDVDDDGRLDLYVANDQTANFLWRNLGGMRFEEGGDAAGVAASGAGGYQAGMGVACGDLDGNGLPDLAVTNFYDEGTTFYQNLGQGIFSDRSAAFGLTAATRIRLGFGLTFLDANNDGRLDLAQANGHVDDFRPESAYAMPPQLFLGAPGGRLVDLGAQAGAPWGRERLGRALVAGDLDNDGRTDLLMACLDEPLVYLRNATEAGHWLTLRLEGTASGRDAVGARVAVTAGGRTRVAWRLGGGSYQSAGDPRLHFGLGDAAKVDSVEVRWPSGRVDRLEGLAADAGHLLREGAAPLPLAGFPAVPPARP
jgi:hypothetical protein